jgi:choline dehydrogenase
VRGTPLDYNTWQQQGAEGWGYEDVLPYVKGALQTPQLLQISGIGPADLLKQHGIDVVHELKGVGENLMNHVQVGRKYTTSSPHTLNKKSGNVFSQALAGIQYYGTRTGPLTIGASLGGAYLSTRPDLEAPDLHVHFLPFMPDDAGWGLAKFSGFRLGMGADLVKAG